MLLLLLLLCRKSSSDLQYFSLKVMLQSKWLSLVLDVDFMPLTILKLEFSFIFFEFIIYLMASSQNFMENYQFNIILSCFKQILDNHLFNITYLHTTCKIFCSFSLNFSCHHDLLDFVNQYVFNMCKIFSFKKFQVSV